MQGRGSAAMLTCMVRGPCSGRPHSPDVRLGKDENEDGGMEDESRLAW